MRLALFIRRPHCSKMINDSRKKLPAVPPGWLLAQQILTAGLFICTIACSIVCFCMDDSYAAQMIVSTGHRTRVGMYSMQQPSDDITKRLYVCFMQAHLQDPSSVSYTSYRAQLQAIYPCDYDGGYPRDYRFMACAQAHYNLTDMESRYFLECLDVSEGPMMQTFEGPSSSYFLGSYNYVSFLLLSMLMINIFMLYTATGFSDDTGNEDYWCAMSFGLTLTCVVVTGIALLIAFIFTFLQTKITYQSTIWTGYVSCAALTCMLLFFCDALKEKWANAAPAQTAAAPAAPATNAETSGDATKDLTAMYMRTGLYPRRRYTYLNSDGAESGVAAANTSAAPQSELTNPKLLQVYAGTFICIDAIFVTGMMNSQNSPIQDLVNMSMFFMVTARLCQYINANFINAFHSSFLNNNGDLQAQIVVAYVEIARITFVAIALMAFGFNSEVVFNLYWNNQLCNNAARLQITFLFFFSAMEFLRALQTFLYILSFLSDETYYVTSQVLNFLEYLMRYLLAVLTIFLVVNEKQWQRTTLTDYGY